MTFWRAIAAIGCLTAGLCVSAVAEPVVGTAELCREPLRDPNAGRLYEPTIELLRASLKMPRRIDLGEIRRATALSSAEPDRQAAGAEPNTETPQQDEQEPDVVVLVGSPVVPDEELGHVLYMAGLYRRASDVYRRLSETDPAEPHHRMMLMLCERNTGQAQATADLLDGLRKDERTKQWAEWMSLVIALGEDEAKEAE